MRLELDRHEFVPRDLAHGRHNAFVECCFADQTAHTNCRTGNFREHLSTLHLKVRRRHYVDLMATTGYVVSIALFGLVPRLYLASLGGGAAILPAFVRISTPAGRRRR